MSTEPGKVAGIFEYLLAFKNLNEKVKRNINDYEEAWWEKDLSNIDGIYISGKGTNEEA